MYNLFYSYVNISFKWLSYILYTGLKNAELSAHNSSYRDRGICFYMGYNENRHSELGWRFCMWFFVLLVWLLEDFFVFLHCRRWFSLWLSAIDYRTLEPCVSILKKVHDNFVIITDVVECLLLFAWILLRHSKEMRILR